ncbi:endonuclease [Altererythrobacter aurantiacus]|uniref:Endonuclease n=1 Tax=Parapontixanthobacter aurantiacus TaxID=1463599 RepID=A0A844ZGN5_9SPHN|nr:endonuclease/exonuclease/phosphatase family protein [Parapontixanthobacter aurantiacus]MXO86150.1 endonuclease [Parapontixanthobacter aurantiacus]
MQLSVATYNIHKGVGRDGRCDPDRIIAVLREVNADVIALQEADERFGSRTGILPRALLDDTQWRVVPVAKRPQSIGWHGNTILARKDVTVVSSRPLDLPTLEPRGAVVAVLEREGQRFAIAGAHLCLSGLRRRAQIKALLGHIEHDCGGHEMPALLTGDFNQWGLRSGAMRVFREAWGRDWQMIAPGPTFPSNRAIARLDRIVASSEWTVDASKVHHSSLAAMASDHLPLKAELSVSTRA